MRTTAAALLICLVCFIVITPAVRSASEDSQVHIGVLLDSLKDERWQRDSKLLQSRAHELGVKMTVKDAEGNDELQIQQASQLIEGGANVLIVVPHDSEKAAALVQAAQRKNVPVISYDRLIRNSALSLYISFDNVQTGKLQATSILSAAPAGNFFLLEGSPLDNNAHQFEKGQKLALKQAEDEHQITVADEAWCPRWTSKEAYDATLAALKKSDGKIAAIVAANDTTAGGAIQALTEHKLAGKIPVSGQDADLAAIVRIVRGTQTMTIYKPLGPLAKRAVDAAITLAHGGKPETSDTISDGSHTVPAILLQPIAVDQKNLGSTIISDGFHSADEIKKALAPGEWEKFSATRKH
jgi:D-xylose transport system substrate-binding protein